MGVYPVVGRSMSGPTGSSWNQQHPDQDLNPPGASRESVSVGPQLGQTGPQNLRLVLFDRFDLPSPPFFLSSPLLQVLSFPEFSSSSVFQMASSSLQDSSAPPLLLTSATPDSPPEDASPSAHSSASLIKAIREELQRLAHKQAAITSHP